jgi:exodeoxyribonuclease VII large subunit
MLRRELHALETTRSRPVLAQPHRVLDRFSEQVDVLLARSRRTFDHHLARAEEDLAHRVARVRALSPLATLQRGYAVVQTTDGHVVRAVSDVAPGTTIDARLADGRLLGTVAEVYPDDS